MKCIATKMGFVNGARVRPGAVFEMKTCPKWAKRATAEAEPAKEAGHLGEKPVPLAAKTPAPEKPFGTSDGFNPEITAIRAEFDKLGVKYDKRWQLPRLQAELGKAKA